MTGLRALTRAGSRACAARRGRRGQTAAGLRPRPRHPPAAILHSGGPTRAHRHHGPVRHSRSRQRNNGGTSRDGNDRPGARSVPSRFQARSGPTMCRGEGHPPRLGIIEAGRVWRHPWCPRPPNPPRGAVPFIAMLGRPLRQRFPRSSTLTTGRSRPRSACSTCSASPQAPTRSATTGSGTCPTSTTAAASRSTAPTGG